MRKTINFLVITILVFMFPVSCEKDDPIISVTSVSISKPSLNMLEGETESLSATVLPDNANNKKTTWKSSNAEIVSVDNSGRVSAHKPGSATITVTTEDGNKTASCSVTVTAKTISVTAVELDKKDLTLIEGDTETLKATVSPADATNPEVTWESDKTDIATVDSDGKVTAVKAGTATITVSTDDGAKTATCKITVQASNIPVTGISLNLTTLQLTAGNSQTLTATVQPANATNKNITWGSSKPSVATVDSNGKITAVAPGNTQIIVTTEDGNHRAICNVVVPEPINQFEKDGIFYVAKSKGSTDVLVTNKKYGVHHPDGSADNSYSGDVNINTVVEYEGVEYTIVGIGSRAFEGSVDLQSGHIPEGLESIGAYAFTGCSSLESLHLPSSVRLIDQGNNVFAGCKNLTITIEPENKRFFMENDVLYGHDIYWVCGAIWLQENKTGSLTIKDETGVIRTNATLYASISKVVIPASVKLIESGFFNYAYDLETVELNWSIEELNKLQYFDGSITRSYFQNLIYSDITLLVPQGTKAAYEAHEVWV